MREFDFEGQGWRGMGGAGEGSERREIGERKTYMPLRRGSVECIATGKIVV